MTPKRFREIVFKHYRTSGRHSLPWRKTRNPYRILVSEMMLQQTQVERVIPYYHAFLKQFPTANVLAHAPLADVLRVWQGLGYNRRAKWLWKAAQESEGKIPVSVEALERLSGVGPYTARAVAAFAGNTDVILVETNIRTAIMHAFFEGDVRVSDTEICKILEDVLPSGQSRDWYAALMDYGSALKQSGVRINPKSTSYSRQTAFAGSSRQARGALLRALASGPKKKASLCLLLGEKREKQMKDQLAALETEGLVARVRGVYQLPR